MKQVIANTAVEVYPGGRVAVVAVVAAVVALLFA